VQVQVAVFASEDSGAFRFKEVVCHSDEPVVSQTEKSIDGSRACTH
jgi:hypothetical protein